MNQSDTFLRVKQRNDKMFFLDSGMIQPEF